jgi:hypothetical protein
MSKKTKKAVRRKPAQSTALALVPKTRAVARVQPGPDWGALIPGGAAPLNVRQLDVVTASLDKRITDETSVSSLGLQPLKLSKVAEAVLSRGVDVADIRIKPTGQVYVSHPTYTKWFNEAFGRLQWSLVPASKPVRTDKGVARDFLLYVHGNPVAAVQGEQDYIESNREQSYGDALEACNASALRRLAKRIGVGLELWDKAWVDAYIREHCVCVDTDKGEKWRRKLDPPLKGEKGVARNQARASASSAVPEYEEPRGYQGPAPQPKDGDRTKITKGTKQRPGQVERLWVIIRNSGRNEQLIRDWLHDVWGYDSTQDIRKMDYEAICKAIEAEGPLPKTKGV